MAEALAKKKRIRAGHKAYATKTIRQIEDILASETPDKERLSLLLLTLNEKLETTQSIGITHRELRWDLLNSCYRSTCSTRANRLSNDFAVLLQLIHLRPQRTQFLFDAGRLTNLLADKRHNLI